jgi:hypothetical protein
VAHCDCPASEEGILPVAREKIEIESGAAAERVSLSHHCKLKKILSQTIKSQEPPVSI